MDRINLMLKNGSSGLALVLITLFLFLSGRVAFWVAVGIPVSFMATLAVLYLAGGSINMLSLFALIMALGIIVDDAIVVAEDAQAHFEMGEDRLSASEGGARRMLGAGNGVVFDDGRRIFATDAGRRSYGCDHVFNTVGDCRRHHRVFDRKLF